MSRRYLVLVFILLLSSLIAQEIQHEAVAVNIEVPVRVFKGDEFIDTLSINDFELYEDGELQTIEAVYLVKKTKIEEEDTKLEQSVARQKFSPVVSSRTFILYFEILDYGPKLGEVIDYFIQEVFSLDDMLIVVTPSNTYRSKGNVLKLRSKDKLAGELKIRLKLDTRKGNAEYKSIIRDIQSGSYSKIDLFRLKELRYLDPAKLTEFSENLKGIEGQKFVFMLFQRGVLPDFAAEEEWDLDCMSSNDSDTPLSDDIAFSY